MKRWSTFTVAGVAVLFGLLPLVQAHGDDNMDMGADAPAPAPIEAVPQSYFRYEEHSRTMLAHIALMVIGWAFVLPVGKSESIEMGDVGIHLTDWLVI